jgi:hypothetical protein
MSKVNPETFNKLARNFSETVMDAFRGKLQDPEEVAVLASVLYAWSIKLKAGEYPDGLLQTRKETPS